jgi:hypothetical protein
VALDASSNIYVANGSNGTVTKYATGGGAPTLTISSGLNGPIGLAVDAKRQHLRLSIPIASVRNGSKTLTPACQSNPDSTLF